MFWRCISIPSNKLLNYSICKTTVSDKKYFRPCEVDSLVGDASKAKLKLGWSPKITIEELVRDMINHDKELARKDALLIKEGFNFSLPNE